jgi:hypothetical protein
LAIVSRARDTNLDGPIQVKTSSDHDSTKRQSGLSGDRRTGCARRGAISGKSRPRPVRERRAGVGGRERSDDQWVLASELSVACGPDAADALAATTGRSGLTNLVVRIAKGLGLTNEESEVKEHFTEGIRAGKLLLAVHVQGDERKAIARQILAENGAGSMVYLDKFTLEVLQR